MTEHEMATMPNYITLACEICLYAYNDLVKQSIDLYCLEHPESDAPHIKERNERLRARAITSLRWMYNHYHARPDTPRARKRIARELDLYKIFLIDDIRTCREFFLSEHPIAGGLGINGERVIRKAEKVVAEWVRTGDPFKLKASVRPIYQADNTEEEEDE